MSNHYSHVSLAFQEKDALQERYKRCFEGYDTHRSALERIREQIDELKSVSINMNLVALVSILLRDTPFANLHNYFRGDLIRKVDRDNVARRLSKDLQAFGSDGERLCFGALNLGNSGALSFGNVCVILKKQEKKLIQKIAFLEEDSWNYYRTGDTSINYKIELGRRALWENVAELAIVKHIQDFLENLNLSAQELADIILQSDGIHENEVYLEAQIYSYREDQLVREDIQEIRYVPPPKSRVKSTEFKTRDQQIFRKYFGEEQGSILHKLVKELAINFTVIQKPRDIN